MKKKLRRLIQSKKTMIVLLVLILTPVVIFSGILIRDSLQKGTPIIGSRNKNQLEHTLSSEQLKQIEDGIKEDMILSQSVNLKASTLRMSIKVSQELDGATMMALAERIYAKVDEIAPIETYFTNSEDNKQYDLEVVLYNDVEDKESSDFWMLEILKTSSMEEVTYEWTTEPRDEEFKAEVLEIMEAKKKEDEMKKNEAEKGEE